MGKCQIVKNRPSLALWPQGIQGYRGETEELKFQSTVPLGLSKKKTEKVVFDGMEFAFLWQE